MSVGLVAKSDKLVQEMNGMRQVLQSHHENLRQLTSQKSENESVRIEFANLEDEANIWKLTGPLMVKQDKEDARANVEKRLEFITAELAKVEDALKKCEQEFEDKRRELIQVQTELQQGQQKGTE